MLLQQSTQGLDTSDTKPVLREVDDRGFEAHPATTLVRRSWTRLLKALVHPCAPLRKLIVTKLCLSHRNSESLWLPRPSCLYRAPAGPLRMFLQQASLRTSRDRRRTSSRRSGCWCSRGHGWSPGARSVRWWWRLGRHRFPASWSQACLCLSLGRRLFFLVLLCSLLGGKQVVQCSSLKVQEFLTRARSLWCRRLHWRPGGHCPILRRRRCRWFSSRWFGCWRLGWRLWSGWLGRRCLGWSERSWRSPLRTEGSFLILNCRCSILRP
mmetsp:Transcript_26718/g.61522  ORF Transcript_26718/g.61522 Transcript_26718/m.61522 type:complete len:267 (-) Transcript_26718:179-979(-)